jgi:hypothetical protein
MPNETFPADWRDEVLERYLSEQAKG